MDWIHGIQAAIDYVEEHITEKLDFGEAAKRAYSSSFHFQRVFFILCGYTLGEYIRMRRLSLAGSELKSGAPRVIDVALKYGYDSPESFSRAFTRFHGVTPMQAKNNANIKSFSRISVKLILDGGNTMNYRIEKLNSFKVVCRKKRFEKSQEISPSPEISRFWAECGRDGSIAKMSTYMPREPKLRGAVGITLGYQPGENVEFPYGIGFEYNGEPVTDQALTVEEIPAQTYAVFKGKGKMPEEFEKLYHQMFTEFFPASEYKPTGRTEFEVYPSANVSDPDFEFEIWCSVEKA